MTTEGLDLPHTCPFESGHADERISPTSAGPWILFVTDDEGIYHCVSELRLVALSRAEADQLEDGDRDVLNDCEGIALEHLLADRLDGYQGLVWT